MPTLPKIKGRKADTEANASVAHLILHNHTQSPRATLIQTDK